MHRYFYKSILQAWEKEEWKGLGERSQKLKHLRKHHWSIEERNSIVRLRALSMLASPWLSLNVYARIMGIKLFVLPRTHLVEFYASHEPEPDLESWINPLEPEKRSKIKAYFLPFSNL